MVPGEEAGRAHGELSLSACKPAYLVPALLKQRHLYRSTSTRERGSDRRVCKYRNYYYIWTSSLPVTLQGIMKRIRQPCGSFTWSPQKNVILFVLRPVLGAQTEKYKAEVGLGEPFTWHQGRGYYPGWIKIHYWRWT